MDGCERKKEDEVVGVDRDGSAMAGKTGISPVLLN